MKVVMGCMLLVVCLRLTAQELIPDSGFEKNRFVPMDFSAINASRSWHAASWGTTDLFCKCDKKTKILREKIYSQVDVPQNPMGYQEPHSGRCYAGLFAFSHGNYREYLQTPLEAPLQKNKTYLFTMYISLADYSRASVDRLGICFLPHKADYPTYDVITDLDPIYITISDEVGNDIKDWHRITALYQAHGGEQYVVIGSFKVYKLRKTKVKAPKEIHSRINQSTERDAYYFIDDVSVVEAGLTEPEPNVAKAEPELDAAVPADTSFILKQVLFQTNETQLLPSSYSELDQLVVYLKKTPFTLIEVFGHTDSTGDETKNKILSEGRAKAVADYLVVQGVDPARIEYTGFGSARPIATNATEEGRQQNRRVEFAVTKK